MACDTPHFVHPDGYVRAIPVPCGRCPPCKKRRVNEWIFRLQNEHLNCFSAYFVTLTYAPDHITVTQNGFMTLVKKDVQLFIKRLRKNETGSQKSPIKYYAVGEYGDTFRRPHYHLIIFNIRDFDSVFKAWTLGVVEVSQLNNPRIAYTLKYMNKDRRVPEHSSDDRVPEFSLMSKRLGSSYFENPDVIRYHKDDIYNRLNVVRPDGVILQMPRYYRDNIFDEHEKRLQNEHISQLFAEREASQREAYERRYSSDNRPVGDYDEHVERMKIHRYNKFYGNQKLRDL